MKVANQITSMPVPAAISPAAMNWLEPANTPSDISWPCQPARWAGATRVPKIRPNGAAPTIIGRVSRAPAAKLERREERRHAVRVAARAASR